jgi:tetratricopeptide (TPR) repeat protein
MTQSQSVPQTAGPRLRRRLGVVVLLALAAAGLIPAAAYLWAGHHFRAAQEADRKRQFGEAREHLEACLRVWPRDPETRLLAARVARRSAAFDEARQHLDVYARVVGKSDALILERALLRAQQGDIPPHLQRQLEALIEDNHPDSVLILEVVSQQYMRSYRLSDALDSLNRWLELAPDDVWGLLRRGWVYEQLNHFDQAMADYERAVDLAPEVDGPRLRLAHALLYGKNDAPQAMPHFQTIYNHGDHSTPVLIGLARCHWEIGEQEKAEQILDQLLASSPDDPEVLGELGKVALELGRHQEAESRLREAVRKSPSSFQAYYWLHQCLEAQGRKDEAQESLAKGKAIKADVDRMQQLTRRIQAEPRNAAIPCEIGRIFLRFGEDRDGVAWIHRALELDPMLESAHQALADHYASVHDAKKAEEHRQLAAEARASRTGSDSR